MCEFGVGGRARDGRYLRLGSYIVGTVASNPGVDFELVTHFAAEELVDWDVEFTGFKIPECDINSCQRAHEDRAAAVEGRAP